MPLLWSALYVLALGIASHVIGEAIPRCAFFHDRFPYRAYRWEREGKIYERIGIQKWKDHAPDMSRVMRDMVPKRVGKAPHAEDVWVLVQETCRAEIVHLGLAMLSLGIVFFWMNWIGALLGLLVALCNVPFILIQRYNRPRLVSLAERLAVREERRRHASTHSVG